jgi:hypothetical protein
MPQTSETPLPVSDKPLGSATMGVAFVLVDIVNALVSNGLVSKDDLLARMDNSIEILKDAGIGQGAELVEVVVRLTKLRPEPQQ